MPTTGVILVNLCDVINSIGSHVITEPEENVWNFSSNLVLVFSDAQLIGLYSRLHGANKEYGHDHKLLSRPFKVVSFVAFVEWMVVQ